MNFSIIIKPSNQEFNAEASKSILESAINSGLYFPHGCKNGNCNRCKCKILSGSFKIKNDLTGINDKSCIVNILACKAYPLSDMVIECDITNHAQKHVGKIISIEKVTDNIIFLDVKLMSVAPFIFKEGQYVDMIFAKNIRRSYSISNSPKINNNLSFHIRHFPGGYFTDKLFGYNSDIFFNVNDLIDIEGPFGNFTLRKDNNNPIIFLAGGTGFAPIKSMIEYIINSKKWRPIYLYWSVSSIQDIYMDHLINQWINEIPDFHYIPVISNSLSINDNWRGKIGNVCNVIMQEMPDMIKYEVYASGPPDMVELAKVNFISQCNLIHSNFFADPFYSYA